jgi:hypothetical protein
MQRIARGAWTKPELLSVPFTIRERIWGGWTYDKCGCKVDRISAEFLQILFLGPSFLSRLRSPLLDQKLLELLSFLNCNFQPPGCCAKCYPGFTIWTAILRRDLLPLQALPRPPRVIFPRPSVAIELSRLQLLFNLRSLRMKSVLRPVYATPRASRSPSVRDLPLPSFPRTKG